MGASIFSPPSTFKWGETPFLTALILLCFFFILQRSGFQHMSRSSKLVYVDTLDETNWTTIASSKISLSRVHKSGSLHHKIWILPFDQMWQLGLSKLSTNGNHCPNAMGAVEMHVTSGASVASAASEIASRIRRGRRVAPLIPLGRPFFMQDGNDREIVHIYGMLIEGIFPINSKKWFQKVVKPIAFIRQCTTLDQVDQQNDSVSTQETFCTIDRMKFLARAVSYAMRRFKMKGFLPKLNPMNNAKIDERICCKNNIDENENLENCWLACDQQNLYNIISVFPQSS